jgi:hypothetical protein
MNLYLKPAKLQQKQTVARRMNDMEIKKDILKSLGAEYRKTLNHNYLVIRKPEDDRLDYELDMIMENRIYGLLDIETRMAEGKEYLYYEISSMQPLRSLYDHKELDWITIRNICIELVKIYRTATDYMIDGSHLCADPSCIYIGMDDGKPGLLFLPELNVGKSENFIDLAEYFLERVCHNDPRAALFAYRFYQTVRKDGFVMTDIERLIENCDMDDGNTEMLQKPVIPEIVEKPEILKMPEPVPEEETKAPVIKKQGDTQNNMQNNMHKNMHKKNPAIAVFSIIAIICLIYGTGVIPGTAPGNSERIAAAALAVSSVIALIYTCYKRSHERKKKVISSPDVNELKKCFDDLPYIEKNIEKNIEKKKEEKPDIQEMSKEDEGYGKTVFWDTEKEEAAGILVDKKGREYRLDHYPYVIGKMPDMADMILKDKTVSRIHARISREENGIYIEDCNSTNGTFLNGVQLYGDEKMLLSKDDEIEIGRVKLEYR